MNDFEVMTFEELNKLKKQNEILLYAVKRCAEIPATKEGSPYTVYAHTIIARDALLTFELLEASQKVTVNISWTDDEIEKAVRGLI